MGAVRFIRPPQGLQDEARRNRSAAVGSDMQEIGAGLQGDKSAAHRNRGDREVRTPELWAQADRRLRPFARRAASTLRPAAVAMRARKPWRRLRTRLLGW